MRNFFQRLKNISFYVYGLSFVTFFMQLGATMVYGSGNAVVSNRLLSPFLLIFVRNSSEALGVFFKIFAGYLSDRVKNRTIFLIIGYGLGILFKICFFITTLDLDLVFLSFVFIIFHIIDRWANAIRDPTKEAFISDNTESEDRLLSFSIRKGIGSLGTFLGGIFTYYIVSNKMLNSSQLYFTAIFPVIFASFILWIMFTKKENSTINLGDNLLKIFTYLVLNILFAYSFKTNILSNMSIEIVILLLSVIPMLFFRNIKHNALRVLTSIFSYCFIYFLLGSNFVIGYFTEDIYMIIFHSFKVITLSILLYFSLYRIFKEYSMNFHINKTFNIIGDFILIFIVFLENHNFNFVEKLVYKPELVFDIFLYKYIIMKFTESKSQIYTIFYIILFNLIKFMLFSNFTVGNIEIASLVYSFFSLLIIFIIDNIIKLCIKYIHNSIFVFIYTSLQTIILIYFSLGLINHHSPININYLIHSDLIIDFLIVFKIVSRAIFSKNILDNKKDCNTLEYIMKSLPIDILSILFMTILLYMLKFLNIYISTFGLTTLLFLKEYIYNYYSVFYNKFQDIMYQKKDLIIAFLVITTIFLSIFSYNIKDVFKIYSIILTIIISFLVYILYDLYKNNIIKLLCTFSFFNTFFNNSIINYHSIVIFFISLLINNINIFNNTFECITKYIKSSNVLVNIYLLIFINFNFYFGVNKLLFLYIFGFILVLFKNTINRNGFNYLNLFIHFSIFCGSIGKIYSFNTAIILNLIYDIVFYYRNSILEYIKNIHFVKFINEEKSNLNTFWGIVFIATLISLGRINDGIFFQRGIDIGYSNIFAAIVLSIMFFFMTISSIIINYFKLNNKENKSLIFISVLLLLSNLFMSGYCPIISKDVSYFISVILVGMYTGAFEIVISTKISKSTEKKSIVGTLFGIYYFISGLLGMVSSFISYKVVSLYGCALCGLYFSIPVAIVFILLISNKSKY